MTGVVYNACYGGFSLSRKAVLLARKLSGNPTWGGPCIKGDTYSDGREVDHDYGYTSDSIKRHDPILVEVVRRLGNEASGPCASLAIAELPSGSAYRIDEYDGMERVMRSGDYDWEVLP